MDSSQKASADGRSSSEARDEIEAFTQLTTIGHARRIISLKSKQVFFTQGSPSDCTFLLTSGRVRLTVVSKHGKEATIGFASAGEFLGEDAAAESQGIRSATATAVLPCTAVRFDRQEFTRTLQTDQQFCNAFMMFLLARSTRAQADLVDQLFNSSAKRLARILLLMAEFDEPGASETLIPPITQETLADMVGTTRSRVSCFMNQFRKLGYIEYNGRIRVHRSLLNVVLHDQAPEAGKAVAAALGIRQLACLPKKRS